MFWSLSGLALNAWFKPQNGLLGKGWILSHYFDCLREPRTPNFKHEENVWRCEERIVELQSKTLWTKESKVVGTLPVFYTYIYPIRILAMRAKRIWTELATFEVSNNLQGLLAKLHESPDQADCLTKTRLVLPCPTAYFEYLNRVDKACEQMKPSFKKTEFESEHLRRVKYILL